MLNNTNNSPLFYEYYAQWVDVYKKGAIREATMAKYNDSEVDTETSTRIKSF